MGDIAYETMEDYRARIRELEGKIRFLEQCLDNKEKVNKSMRKDNKSLREEIRKLKEERDFFKEQAILWRNDYKNEYEKNIKLKEDIDNGFNRETDLRNKRADSLLENKDLRDKIEELEKTLEHRDSFFSIMRDVLANEDIDNTELSAILYCVVHHECGDIDLSKKELEIVNNFWRRKYC